VFHERVAPWQGLVEGLVKTWFWRTVRRVARVPRRDREALGLDSMRRVEVVALLEHLQLEVRDHSA
jgi:hypothetical protein